MRGDRTSVSIPGGGELVAVGTAGAVAAEEKERRREEVFADGEGGGVEGSAEGEREGLRD